MKKHQDIARLLAIYRDLDPADRAKVDQHLQSCNICGECLTAYQTMDRDLARLPDPRPDRQLREEFYAAVQTPKSQTGLLSLIGQRLIHIPTLTSRVMELALLTLLIVGLGITIRAWLQSPISPTAPMPTPALVNATDLQSSKNALPGEISVGGARVDALETNDAQATDQLGVDDRLDDSSADRQNGDSAAISVQSSPPFASQGSFYPQPTLAQDGEEGRVYVVQADDSLWKLAEKYLGDGRRFPEIIDATHAMRANDPSFALIENPSLISPGSKLWIPTGKFPAPSAKGPVAPATVAGEPDGHIAFSFWNDHPARCTYEINIIEVTACMTNLEACQANRRIFALNNVSEPALSPEGDRLAFRGWGEPPSEDSPYLNCAPSIKFRFLANTTLDGTELQGTGGFWEDSHPDWSPNGQQILFDSERHSDRIARIFLINADGSNERDLYIAGQQPAWGSDGQRFVYRGCDLTGNRCGLWLANAAPVKSWEVGANMIGPVIQDEQAAHPDWSPVSDEIVYQSSSSGSWDLYVVNDGTNIRQLTNDPAIEGLPAWSPDGQWIVYLSNAGGNWGIWIIQANGSERHLLFPFDGGIFTPKPVEPYGQRDWIDEQISWSQ